MKKNIKKMLALLLALVMVAGSSLTSLAANVQEFGIKLLFQGSEKKESSYIYVRGYEGDTADITDMVTKAIEGLKEKFTPDESEFKVVLGKDKELVVSGTFGELPEKQKVEVVYYDYANNITAHKEIIEIDAADKVVSAELLKKMMPKGYTFETEGLKEVAIVNYSVNVAVVKTTRPVEILYYDHHNQVKAGEYFIDLDNGVQTLSREEVAAHLPENYKLEDNDAQFEFTGDVLNVAVVKTTRPVEVVYYDHAAQKAVGRALVEVKNDEEGLSEALAKANLPKGYALEDAKEAPYRINENDEVSVAVVKTTRPVEVIYYDHTAQETAGKATVEVEKGVNTLTRDEVQAELPENYKLADDFKEFQINKDVVNVAVVKDLKTVKVIFFMKVGDAEIVKGSAKLDVLKNASSVNSSEVKGLLSDEYEIVALGDQPIVEMDGQDSVLFEIKAVGKDVEVIYYDHTTQKTAGKATIKVVGDKASVEMINEYMPSGYKLEDAEAKEFVVRNGVVNVPVVEAKRDVEVIYYDHTAQKTAGKVTLKLAGEKVSVEEINKHMPERYKLEDAEAKEFAIVNDAVNVPVKVATKVVKVNFYDETADKQISEVEIEVAGDATHVNTNDLTAPKGYKLVLSGDLPIRGEYVYAAVEVATKVVKVNFYDETADKQISEVEIEVAGDATHVNTNDLTAPEGYKLVLSGDLPIRDGYVYAAVKVATKVVKVNFYDETAEKQIAEKEMTVAGDATYVNTNDLEVPEGYELVLAGDLPIRDGYVYAAVRKVTPATPIQPAKERTTLKVAFVTLDGEVVDVQKLVDSFDVETGAVLEFKLGKDYKVPEGYELIGKQPQTLFVKYGYQFVYPYFVEKVETPVDPDPQPPVDPDPQPPVDPDPQPPVDPDPQPPVDPEKPATPDKDKEEKPAEDDTVKTGDTSMVYTYVVVMLGAAVLMTIAVAKRRNHR